MDSIKRKKAWWEKHCQKLNHPGKKHKYIPYTIPLELKQALAEKEELNRLFIEFSESLIKCELCGFTKDKDT